MSIRFPSELHTELKIKMAKEGKTIQDYVLNLIISDMGYQESEDDTRSEQEKKDDREKFREMAKGTSLEIFLDDKDR